MRYIVDVGIPTTSDWTWNEGLEEEIEGLAHTYGSGIASSGTGMGFRDVQFEVYGKAKAHELQRNIAMTLERELGGVLDEDDQPAAYASVYHEPKNLVVFLISVRDYKEAWHEFWSFLPWSHQARVDRRYERENPPHWSELQFTIPAEPGDAIYEEQPKSKKSLDQIYDEGQW